MPDEGRLMCSCLDQDRRRAVSLLAGTELAVVLPVHGAIGAGRGLAKAPPALSDELVFTEGEQKGKAIIVAGLALVVPAKKPGGGGP